MTDTCYFDLEDRVPEPGRARILLNKKVEAIAANAINMFIGDTKFSFNNDIFMALLGKIEFLSSLDTNWDSYGAEAPNSKSIENAKWILEVLREIDFAPTKITPSSEGGIAIVFKSNNNYADFECFNDGEILMALSDQSGAKIKAISSEGVNQGISDIHAIINPRRSA